jgi:hypothetical protein
VLQITAGLPGGGHQGARWAAWFTLTTMLLLLLRVCVCCRSRLGCQVVATKELDGLRALH